MDSRIAALSGSQFQAYGFAGGLVTQIDVFCLDYISNTIKKLKINITKILKPGGIMCLIDLDHNCLSHYGIPPRLQRTVNDIMFELQKKANFDPYAGRKI